ncbi:hypothetical protein [Streptomyces sp. NBC_01361]|uniref:hypothetical protein n=1 Tax=Streptomyces sp. NBC_01361 TaxID=2903838 RepID=UPI002E369FA5|nr:hypothetical protein [Streptomyces sp. NBC_01361]
MTASTARRAPRTSGTNGDTFAPGRARRASLTLGVLLALTTAVLALMWGPGVPDAWWPQTGKAFALDHTPAPAHPAAARTSAGTSDVCDLIVGPAKAYCQRQDNTSPDCAAGIPRAAALLLVPALLGIALLALRRRRHAAAT